jgi:hypothetical protein
VADLHETHGLVYDIGRLTFPQPAAGRLAKSNRSARTPTYAESHCYNVDNTVVLYQVDIKLDAVTIPQLTSILADLFDGHYRSVMMLVRRHTFPCCEA